MPLRTREDLWRAVREKRLASLYLLYGPETYLRDVAAGLITDNALQDSSLREFNDNSFSLVNYGLQAALASAEQLPLMSGKRVVRLTECQNLREADEESVMRYLNRPVESTVFIFIANDLDKRRRIAKALLEKCYTVEFAALADAELVTWARRHLKEAKVTIDDRTLAQVIALVGSNVRMLANELDKLATAALGEGVITWEMADTLVGRSRELSNFALTDLLLAGNRSRALQVLHSLLEDRAEPVLILGLLASHYHRLLLAKQMVKKGAPREEVFRVVALPYSKRDEFLTHARRSETDSLKHALRLIADADLAIKTSKGTPRLQLEMLVCSLAN